MLQDNPFMYERIRALFALARQAVHEELGIRDEGRQTPANGSAASVQPLPSASKPGNGWRPASDAQLRVLSAICARLDLDLEEQARQRYSRSLGELSLAEASSLIDLLKVLPANR